MLMVCPNEGKTYFLNNCVNANEFSSDDWHVRLFQNDYTPVEDSELADFDEADFTGYDQVSIAQGSWDAAVIVADVAEVEYGAPPTYTCTGGAPQTVYGWYIVSDGANVVLLAQRFDDPREMVPGAVESLDPFKIKLKTFS